MGSVAIRTARRHRVTASGRLPVQAFRVLLLFVSVTRTALNGLRLLGMWELLSTQIAVTTRAFERRMGRGPQGSLVERGRNPRLPLAGATARFVAADARLAPRQRFGLLSPQARWGQEHNCRGANNDERTTKSAEGHLLKGSPHYPRVCEPVGAGCRTGYNPQNDASVLGAHDRPSWHGRLARGSSWPRWPCHEVAPGSAVPFITERCHSAATRDRGRFLPAPSRTPPEAR